MKDNNLIALTVFLNVLKDIAVVAIFGELAWYFHNIWIVLFAVLFTGGYHIKIGDKEEE